MGCICKICYEYDRLFATHVITCSKFGKISCQFKKNAGQDKKKELKIAAPCIG